MLARSLPAVLALVAGIGCAHAAAPDIASANLTELRFADLPGWAADDHQAALAVFARSCAKAPRPALRSVCAALNRAKPQGAAQAKAFFERHFTPYRVTPTTGRRFLTGYYEPELPGSLNRNAAFPVPLLARPDDLVAFTARNRPAHLPADLVGARRVGGRLEPYPNRAEIEDGALGAKARPIVFLRDQVDAFTVHIQGSTRVRLSNGQVMRVAFDGKNGQPYTSIGRVAVQEGHLKLEEATMDRLSAWMRANPDEGRRLMRMNKSYIFFRHAKELNPALGPVGGSGAQLTNERSLAVDSKIWPYGLPIWLDVDLSDVEGAGGRVQRLTLAQDTGTAIVGPARADLFVGAGDKAGIIAGRIRHEPDFVVLWPKAAGGQ